MSKLYDTYRPEGFHTVNGYLFVADPEGMIHFLEQAFEAEELNRTLHPVHGDLANVIMKIGDSCIMLSQARPPFEGMATAFYLYVSDVDALYEKALKAGAESVFPPADLDYGDRQGGVKDPSGTYWWISERLVKEPYKD